MFVYKFGTRVDGENHQKGNSFTGVTTARATRDIFSRVPAAAVSTPRKNSMRTEQTTDLYCRINYILKRCSLGAEVKSESEFC